MNTVGQHVEIGDAPVEMGTGLAHLLKALTRIIDLE
jgi:hypothetical protein